MAGAVRRMIDRLRFRFWMLRDALADRIRGTVHRQNVFGRIHARNLWGDRESVSGTGSGTGATEAVRRELPGLFRQYGIRSVLDAPCGDFSWMKEIAGAVDRYIGADIVPELIARNTAAWARDGISFIRADIVSDSLPTVDLVLCRDCFIHLPTRLIRGALRNFRATGARYLLLTNDRNAAPYHDIPVGSFRPIDWSRPPFSFPAPIRAVNETADGNRQLCLGDLRALPLNAT